MDFTKCMMIILIVAVVSVIVVAIVNRVNDTVHVKSGRAVETYDYIKYFKEDRDRIQKVEKFLSEKQKEKYKVRVNYTSPAGRTNKNKVIVIHMAEVQYVRSNPAVVMSATEYNQILRAQRQVEKDRERAIKEEEKKRVQATRDQKKAEKEAEREKMRLEKEAEKEKIRLEKEALKAEQQAILEEKRRKYCDKVDEVIEYSNTNKDLLIIKSDKYELDRLVSDLYAGAYAAIKKANRVDSGEWDLFDIFISDNFNKIKKVVERNKQILDYYESLDFKQIKDTCNALMESQRDFNEYIEEKAQSIADVFGSRVVRSETENEYKQNYFRPYKKTITPFTAEVTKTVFASAENDPIEYIIKTFYPNKYRYPEQIQKLQLLIGELETLRDAKQIIDNYKMDYQQYLTGVPDYVMANDKDGFYARLGFADISESVLTIEYRFVYTSFGGMVQKSFPVCMTEENISALIDRLESKLTIEAFTKEQRALMTQKLREQIKERDDFTCRKCGNSTHKEPNLLLEIDHIIPVSKGGSTIESNLQTLCWKCNREKSNKIIPK